MRNGAHDQYKKRQVEGVDQGTLIIMLYDGGIKFLNLAIDAIDNKDMEGAHNNIIRTQAVMTELINSLNVDAGEVVLNLLKLYEFMVRQLCSANASKDKTIIEGVVKLLTSLREGWLAIIDRLKGDTIKTEAPAKEDIEKAPVNFSA